MLHGVMTLAKLKIESSVILPRTAIRDPAFLLLRFSHPAFFRSVLLALLGVKKFRSIGNGFAMSAIP